MAALRAFLHEQANVPERQQFPEKPEREEYERHDAGFSALRAITTRHGRSCGPLAAERPSSAAGSRGQGAGTRRTVIRVAGLLEHLVRRRQCRACFSLGYWPHWMALAAWRSSDPKPARWLPKSHRQTLRQSRPFQAPVGGRRLAALLLSSLLRNPLTLRGQCR